MTTYTYNSNDGRVKSIENHLHDFVYYEYDTSGRVKRQWGGATPPVAYDYTAYGEVWKQHTFRSLAAGWTSGTWPTSPTADTTEMTYDGPTGLLTQKLDAASKSTDYTYNQQGQVETRLWSRLNSSSARISTTYTYASLTGELTRMAYNDGTPQADYTYDRLGLMLSAQDVYNGSSVETRTFEYDSSQRLITEKNPAYLGSRWLTYTYESAGSGTLAGRSSGYTMGASGGSGDLISAYAYDTAGRIGSLKATHDGVAERTFTYGYVSGSSLVSGVSEPTTTGYSQTRAYESNRDLLKEFTTKFSSTTKSRYDYTFNTLGQRVTAKQSGDAYVSLGAPSFYHYTYNSRGEVTAATGYLCVSESVTNYSLPMPGRAYAFAYDAAGNRTSATCTTNGSLLDLVTSNNLNQITARENHSNPVSGVLDSNANLLVNGTLASRQGNYWSADVLLNNSSGFAYATSTLKVGKAGSPDLKQISTISSFIAAASETLTYDHDGNITGDGRWMYAWDAENRLASMQTTSAAITAGLPGKKLEFGYDSTGRRISKKVSNWSTGSGTWGSPTETRFIHQGWNLVAELNASGNRIRTYAWGLDLAGSLTATGGVGALVQLVDHTGTATAYLPGYDGSGNVAALMKDDGTIAAMYEYGPFGDPLRREGTYQGANPFRHATKYTDNESGYVNYGTRCYDPRNGRFLNRDTIGEAGGLNLYAFVGNNPINRIDVLGRDAFMTWNGAGGVGNYWSDEDNRESGYDRGGAFAASMMPSWASYAEQALADALAKTTTTMALKIYNGKDAAAKTAAFNWLGLGASGTTLALSLAWGSNGSLLSYRIDDTSTGRNVFSADIHRSASTSITGPSNRGGSALGNALRNIPLVGGLLGAAGDIVSGVGNVALGAVTGNGTTVSNGFNQIGRGAGGLATIIALDIYAQARGIVATVQMSLVRIADVISLGHYKSNGNPLAAVGKLIHGSIIPMYGNFAGAGYGQAQGRGEDRAINHYDYQAFRHDYGWGTEYRAHWNWVTGNYSTKMDGRTPTGPLGIAHVLAGTIPYIIADIFDKGPRPSR